MSITVLFNASRPPKIGDSHASNKVRKRGGWGYCHRNNTYKFSNNVALGLVYGA
jgi:hypothetical protein